MIDHESVAVELEGSIIAIEVITGSTAFKRTKRACAVSLVLRTPAKKLLLVLRKKLTMSSVGTSAISSLQIPSAGLPMRNSKQERHP